MFMTLRVDPNLSASVYTPGDRCRRRSRPSAGSHQLLYVYRGTSAGHAQVLRSVSRCRCGLKVTSGEEDVESDTRSHDR